MGAGTQRWWRAPRYERECVEWRAQQFARVDREIIASSTKNLKQLRQRIADVVTLLRQIGQMT